MALIAALWLVVAITVVALQFSLDARERRSLGLAASERGTEQALASGALALVQARLEQVLRVAPSGTGAVANLRGSDPWLGADSLYSGPYYVDSTRVDVTVKDLGTQLNVNDMTEDQLRTFFSFVIKDYGTSDHLAQCIMDWRDADSIPRANGAEADQYIKDGLLALPTNAPFREVSDLLDVEGMTPDIYNQVAPYLRTRGAATVNLNTAPEAVLRALPGMTDQIILLIEAYRSQGRRISSVAQVMPPVPGAGRGGRGGGAAAQARNVAMTTALQSTATVNTTLLELTIVAQTGTQAQPARLIADITRTGTSTTVSYRQW
jgi:general secretion pathway protein K